MNIAYAYAQRTSMIALPCLFTVSRQALRGRDRCERTPPFNPVIRLHYNNNNINSIITLLFINAIIIIFSRYCHEFLGMSVNFLRK